MDNPWGGSSGDTELMKLYKIGQSGGRNPAQENQYQQLLQQNGLSGSSTPGSFMTDKTLANAKAAQQFQVQANQPAIQTLQKQQTDLDTQYKDLLDSIKGQQKVAEDAQTVATNNELGRRGITADSGVAQQQLASALRPIASQYQGLTANTGVQRQRELESLAAQIASLQAGNAPQALNFASGINSIEQQAQNMAQNYALENRKLNMANAPEQAQRYINVGAGGLFDTETGQLIQGIQSLRNQVGGGNDPY